MWSRFFAPWAGIAEDPVTGSLHACLGPYWDKKLGTLTNGVAHPNDSSSTAARLELRFRRVRAWFARIEIMG